MNLFFRVLYASNTNSLQNVVVKMCWVCIQKTAESTQLAFTISVVLQSTYFAIHSIMIGFELFKPIGITELLRCPDLYSYYHCDKMCAYGRRYVCY